METNQATILVVDDNTLHACSLAKFIQSKGYQTITAFSGREALAKTTERPPDLILLDMTMPEMDGLEVLRRLRASLAGVQIPVIFLSAIDDPQVMSTARQLGACDYWVKASFQLKDIPAALARHLSRCSACV